MGELVRIVESKARTTSLLVAEAFGKRHNNVLRAIRQLLAQRPDLALNFGEMVAEVSIGSGAKRSNPYFSIDRDGFMLLVMGFTGERALDVKMLFIAEFNRMEAIVRDGPAALPTAERAKILSHPNFATAEARDATMIALRAMRRVERMEGTAAAYELWLELGLPDVAGRVRAKQAALPKVEPEKPMATVMAWASACEVTLSATEDTIKADLWMEYESWAINNGFRFMEPPRFFAMIRDQFGIESRRGAFPVRIGKREMPRAA